MRIYFGQIYVQVGATFPFSFAFNHWLGNALSHRVVVTENFCKKYSAEYRLGFRISAKREIEQPEIRGVSEGQRRRVYDLLAAPFKRLP
jgi:hypothetical protein